MVADGAPGNDALHAELQQRASAAADAYSALAAVLRDEIGPHARGEDAFGRDAYRLFSRVYPRATSSTSTRPMSGACDLLESHCGRTGVDRPSALSRLVGRRGAAAAGRGAALSVARHRRAAGLDAGVCPTASVDALADTHFDIAEPLRTLECRIAPTQTGGIYYTGPSEDLTRPGRMWWSVPPGVDTFPYLAGDHHRLPRRRARSSPADRPGRRARRPAEPLAPDWAAGCRVTARAGRCTPSG